MSQLTNAHYLRYEPYGKRPNLDSRIGLHARFSVNLHGWQRRADLRQCIQAQMTLNSGTLRHVAKLWLVKNW
jgi:hypothetical protein